jgi:hypothetical protein
MGVIGFKNRRLKLVRGTKLGYRVAVSFNLPRTQNDGNSRLRISQELE